MFYLQQTHFEGSEESSAMPGEKEFTPAEKEDLCERIAVYESMALHLRAEVQSQIQAHIMQVSRRIEEKMDDYVATRIGVIESQLNVFERVENALLQEREQLETDKQEFLIHKLQQGVVPSSSSSSTYGGFSAVR